IDTLQAAILLAKLTLFGNEIDARIRIGARYSDLLQSRGAASSEVSDGAVLTPFIAPGNASVYAQYTIQVDERDRVGEALAAEGIPTAVHYPVPLNDQPVFQPSLERFATPVSSRVAQRVISLPMHPYLSDEDQVRIVDAVAKATRATRITRDAV
ncbi:MAG: aminotransferase DegT, partial [Gammaproteobacteria bacterium]|nr:aminotransferase DegT [Gammaproteobacteria bacterium]